MGCGKYKEVNMMMNLNKSYEELYTELLNNYWQQIRDGELTAAPMFVGKRYDESQAKLMIVGRAVNGWEIKNGDCSSFENAVQSVLYQPSGLEDVTHKGGMKYLDEQGNEKIYYYTRSRFWKLVKVLLEVYGESEKDNWYDDSYQWNERILWSNLYKLAPKSGGNPGWKLIEETVQANIEILKKEIELKKPENIVFIVNANTTSGDKESASAYFSLYKNLPSFEKELGVRIDKIGERVVGKGHYNGSNVVVCVRPEKMSNAEIEEFAHEIKSALESIELK